MDIGDVSPVKVPLTLLFNYKDTTSFQEMIKEAIIRPSSSAQGTCAVNVLKGNGEARNYAH